MGHYSASDFPFKGSIGQLIGVSAATKDRILEKHLAALDITAAQFKVLIFVGLNRANSPVELCRELSVDSGSMTRMLARLEKKGLLLRGRCPEDRRCLRLDLSEAGRKVQEQPADRLGGDERAGRLPEHGRIADADPSADQGSATRRLP